MKVLLSLLLVVQIYETTQATVSSCEAEVVDDKSLYGLVGLHFHIMKNAVREGAISERRFVDFIGQNSRTGVKRTVRMWNGRLGAASKGEIFGQYRNDSENGDWQIGDKLIIEDNSLCPAKSKLETKSATTNKKPTTTLIHAIGQDCTKTFGGNAKGACCEFPFIFKGKSYNECTFVGNGKSWCYIKGGKLWGNCAAPTGCKSNVKTYGGPAKGACCVLPFKYKGKVYHECTKKDSHAKWCHTENDFKWGYCKGS